jgi:hypothetical protein
MIDVAVLAAPVDVKNLVPACVEFDNARRNMLVAFQLALPEMSDASAKLEAGATFNAMCGIAVLTSDCRSKRYGKAPG